MHDFMNEMSAMRISWYHRLLEISTDTFSRIVEVWVFELEMLVIA